MHIYLYIHTYCLCICIFVYTLKRKYGLLVKSQFSQLVTAISGFKGILHSPHFYIIVALIFSTNLKDFSSQRQNAIYVQEYWGTYLCAEILVHFLSYLSFLN